MEQIFLEDWLRAASSPSSSLSPAPATRSSPEFAANSVVHAWAEIRACVHHKTLTDAQRAPLELLFRHRRSLHYADSQVKLLLALMTDVTCNDAALLGYARKFAVLGVLAWVRKCYTSRVISPGVQKQAPEQLATVVRTLKKAMNDYPTPDTYACEGILLLGVICNLAMVSHELRSECCSLIAVELGARRKAIVRGSIGEALAGAGYALHVCQEQHIASIYRSMVQLWTSESAAARPENSAAIPSTGVDGLQGEPWENPSLNDVIMLLHLLDYMGSQFLSRYPHQDTLKPTEFELLCDEVLRLPAHNISRDLLCATIMASFGLLRSLYRYIPKKVSGAPVKVLYPKLNIMIKDLEGFVCKICGQVITPDASMSTFGSSVVHGGAYADGVFHQTQNMLLMRCTAVGVSRCPKFPARPGVLRCLALSIFEDVLRLDAVYLANREENVNGLVGGKQDVNDSFEKGWVADDLDAVLVAFKVHTESFIFQEVGALARALCEQYRKSRGDQQGQTVQYIWEFARKLHACHRRFVATSGKLLSKTGLSHYAQTMEKYLEAVFLTIVVFFNTAVVKDRARESSAADLAALTLDAFSCVEYFRHLQLKEYVEVIKTAVTRVSNSEAGSVSYVNKFPHYNDIIRLRGPVDATVTYHWDRDEVMSSRVLFYFRVLPLCLDTLPDAVFVQQIAPVLFLFLQHPLEAMTKASHALLAAFLSSKLKPEASSSRKFKVSSVSDTEIEPDVVLREQLVVYYAQRALELFPDVTPFKGLVSGFSAIARHLPSGSPAVVYCLSRLAERTKALYNVEKASERNSRPSQDPASGTEPARVDGGEQTRKLSVADMGVAEKLQALLLHLILTVDLQVLPELLKLVASLTLSLPLHQQTVALGEIYDIVAVTDDYTRKPVVIPWLQTLSFHVFNIQRQVQRTPGCKL